MILSHKGNLAGRGWDSEAKRAMGDVAGRLGNLSPKREGSSSASLNQRFCGGLPGPAWIWGPCALPLSIPLSSFGPSSHASVPAGASGAGAGVYSEATGGCNEGGSVYPPARGSSQSRSQEVLMSALDLEGWALAWSRDQTVGSSRHECV